MKRESTDGKRDSARGNPQSAIPNPQSDAPNPIGAANITLVAGGAKARLLAEAGVVDAAIDFDAMPFHEVFSDARRGPGRLAEMLGPCDRIVSCFVEADTPPARRLAEMCHARELVSLPIRPPRGYPRHLTDLWRQRLGLVDPVAPAAWSIPPAWQADAAGAMRKLGLDPEKPRAVLHPGAGAPEKCWPIGHFEALADNLRSAGLDVLFVLGPVETDRWPAERIAALQAAGVVLAGPPLGLLAGILAGAALFVGNDSGPAHLAAAVGAPTVALFGPTRPAGFAPLGPRVACVTSDTLADITVAQVATAAGELVRWPR